MLIGNKNDLIERRAVRREKAQEYANSHGLPYLETSARSGSNVSEMFVDPARQLIADIESKRLIVSGNVGSTPLRKAWASRSATPNC